MYAFFSWLSGLLFGICFAVSLSLLRWRRTAISVSYVRKTANIRRLVHAILSRTRIDGLSDLEFTAPGGDGRSAGHDTKDRGKRRLWLRMATETPIYRSRVQI